MSATNDTSVFALLPQLQDIVPDTRPRRKKARTLRESDWEPYRDEIIQLHLTERRPLPEVKNMIEQETGFAAEIRQYRSRLTQWKLDKNIKPEEMKAIVRHRQQRGLIDTNKGSLRFRVRGQEVEPQKIERWMKRHDLRESMIYAPSPAASTPSAVSYATISEIGSPGIRLIPSPGAIQDVDMDSNNSPPTPRQNIGSPPTTPRLASTDPRFGPFVNQTNHAYVYAKWQYEYTIREYEFERDIPDFTLDLSPNVSQVLEATSESLSSVPDKQTVIVIGRSIAQILIRDWIGMRISLGAQTDVNLHFYIQQVPSTETVNVRLYVNAGLSPQSWIMGFDLVKDLLATPHCKAAWTSGTFSPTHLPESIKGWPLVEVPWDELQPFSWAHLVS